LKRNQTHGRLLSVATIRTIRLRWSHGTLQELTSQLARGGYPQFTLPPWQPAINAYRCEDCVRVCVELAGVDRSAINLTVRERNVSIRGVREVPEPNDTEGRAVQTIAMEIDYGAFERELHLPAAIDVEKVHAEQRNGLLWIHLPLKKS
jgi:HSP20 family protein